MDDLHAVPSQAWPKGPGAVFGASFYLFGVTGWVAAMAFGLLSEIQTWLATPFVVALIIGSLWWRILYHHRRLNTPTADFQGRKYREQQLEMLALALVSEFGPMLLTRVGFILGMAIVGVFGFAFFRTTEYVTSRWPGRP